MLRCQFKEWSCRFRLHATLSSVGIIGTLPALCLLKLSLWAMITQVQSQANITDTKWPIVLLSSCPLVYNIQSQVVKKSPRHYSVHISELEICHAIYKDTYCLSWALEDQKAAVTWHYGQHCVLDIVLCKTLPTIFYMMYNITYNTWLDSQHYIPFLT